MTPRVERLKAMKSDYNFNCQCEACTENYRDLQQMKTFDEDFEMPNNTGYGKEAYDELKKGCEYVDRYISQFPCQELSVMMTFNIEMMKKLTGKTSFYRE